VLLAAFAHRLSPLCLVSRACSLGVPEVQDGQYVLISHGHILKVLTQAEFVKLRAAGARMFASVMILFYFMPVMYWWFRRGHQKAG